MIGKIAGRLEYRSTDHVLIDVRGIGYIVYVSDRVMAGLPGNGEAVALFTDLLVREDNLQLFGFTTLVEKEWHRLLMSVQGIGAKASLAILGTLGADGVSRAIALGDWSAVAKAKGVGPKTSQRVIIELKDKAPGVMAMGGSVAEALGDEVIEVETPSVRRAAVPMGNPASAEALSALGNLGYAPGEAASAVAEAAEAIGQHYVNHRWLGGTLTNLSTIRRSVERLKYLEDIEKSPDFKKMSKKELSALGRERNKLFRNLKGVRDMEKLPAAMVIVDSARETIAVAEARRLNIPVIAIVDTNGDPHVIDYPIPGNDDATRSIRLLLQNLVDSIVVAKD